MKIQNQRQNLRTSASIATSLLLLLILSGYFFSNASADAANAGEAVSTSEQEQPSQLVQRNAFTTVQSSPQAIGPDLVIESLTISSNQPQVNQPFTIRMVIKNQGTEDLTGGFNSYLYVDPPDQPPTATTKETTSNGWFLGLPVGQTFAWERSGEIIRTGGCINIYAWIDRDNIVAESDENNNLKEITVCTNGPISSPSPSPSSSPSPSPSPIVSDGDSYEPDNTCAAGGSIPTDGTVQNYTFHVAGDTDWVKMDVTTDKTYVIEGTIPLHSRADVKLEVYEDCASDPQETQENTFAQGVHLEFEAQSDGTMYLKLSNHTPSVAGSEVSYELSVRSLEQSPPDGVQVIVAGKLRDNDKVQSNIYNITNNAYMLFLANSTNPDDQILYLAPDTTLDANGDSVSDIDREATTANLEYAITQWAVSKVEPGGSFTLYMVDHGANNGIYLDGTKDEKVTPQQLDSWLTILEDARPDVKVNVIIESSHSGSFVDNTGISKLGRLIVTSAGVQELAYASRQGVSFSDRFIYGLNHNQSVYNAFNEARKGVQSAFHTQSPLLEANGNTTPNEPADEQIAQTRGFGFGHGGTFCLAEWTSYIFEATVYPLLEANGNTTPNEPKDGKIAQTRGFGFGHERTSCVVDVWIPYIFAATGPTGVVSNGSAEITATVRDNVEVTQVWAVVYPPSYTHPDPDESESMVVIDIPSQPLTLQSGTSQDGIYTTTLQNLVENGTYRVVLYAEDLGNGVAIPVTIDVEVGSSVTPTPTPTSVAFGTDITIYVPLMQMREESTISPTPNPTPTHNGQKMVYLPLVKR